MNEQLRPAKSYSKSVREQNIDKTNLKRIIYLYKSYIFGGFNIVGFRMMSGYIEFTLYAPYCFVRKIKLITR